MFQNILSKISLLKPSFKLIQTNKRALTSTQKLFWQKGAFRRAKNFQPHTAVGLWQLGIAGLAAGAVIIGGLTRLKESGLSMTSYNLIKGMKKPSSEEEWQAEFDRYKQFPEYKDVHYDMDLEGFKKIFFWEYLHRMWGRGIGVAYILPYLYFLSRGHLARAGITSPASAMLGVLLAQGAMGWYMVKSGLDEKHLEARENSIARVSQYRLASHLSLAFVILGGCLNNALNCLTRPGKLATADNPRMWEALGKAKKLKSMAPGMTLGMVSLAIISGAFVAGLDAGMIYNNYPHMSDTKIIPEEVGRLGVKDFTENPTTVQLEHRLITHLTYASILACCLVGYKARHALPPNVKLALSSVLGTATLQVALGISTILNQCETELAASHQAGSVALFSTCIWLLHTMKRF